MRRSAILLLRIWVWACVVTCPAWLLPAHVLGMTQDRPEERDLTAERVERAEADYHQSCDSARARLVEALNEAVFRAADAGDLEELEALEAQRAAFEEEGELPPARAVRREALAYHRALERAADELGRVYERVIREYTRERRIDEARAMRTKLAMLEAGVTLEKVEYDGHLYAIVTVTAAWDDARAFCLAIGGDLVALDDRGEANFVAELAEQHDVARFWIGANDEAEEGTWVWADGSPCLYTAWHPHEPNGRRIENHADMIVESQTWSDFPSTTRKAYVCEWAPAVDEEATD